MLASDAPILGICCNAAPRFWHLRISTVFDRPGYYIGQTVLHRMKVPNGEILHPVTIIGLWWNGASWTYFIQLPEDHPEFESENHQVDQVDHWLLEAM